MELGRKNGEEEIRREEGKGAEEEEAVRWGEREGRDIEKRWQNEQRRRGSGKTVGVRGGQREHACCGERRQTHRHCMFRCVIQYTHECW